MNDFFKQLGRVLLSVSRFSFGFLAWAVGLLASSARTKSANDALNNTIRGGAMNHRTGKFDDGRDPAGWYERD